MDPVEEIESRREQREAEARERKIQPGDWVRFYQDTRLVIGEVRYLGKSTKYPYSTLISTDQGEVAIRQVFEVRRTEHDWSDE